jgi:hypothetical protein
VRRLLLGALATVAFGVACGHIPKPDTAGTPPPWPSPPAPVKPTLPAEKQPVREPPPLPPPLKREVLPPPAPPPQT